MLLLHLMLDQVDAWAAGDERVTRVLHMIGNAHIDPVWLWQWPEGYQEVRATFQSAVDRLDEYPDFVFTSDSVAVLRLGRGARPGAVRADPRAGRRGALAGDRG